MYFQLKSNLFFKLIVHKINSEMIKSKMVMLTEREYWRDWYDYVLDIIGWYKLLLEHCDLEKEKKLM
jgi:hypothetical protein